MNRRDVTRDDRGSMLPLVVGLVVVVVAMVAVVTDASVLWLRKRALQSAVDGAALAGAQAVDLDAVYAGGAHGDLALDPPAARRAVRAYLRDVGAAGGLPGVRVGSIVVAGPSITVRARSVVDLPFTSFVTGGRGVTVVAEAGAVMRVPG